MLFRRETAYRKTPVNICRHIVLSESNEIRGFLPNVRRWTAKMLDLDVVSLGSGEWPNLLQFRSFSSPRLDRWIPTTRTVSQSLLSPLLISLFRPTMEINSSYNRLGMIVRSFLPNFNLDVRSRRIPSIRRSLVLELSRSGQCSRRCRGWGRSQRCRRLTSTASKHSRSHSRHRHQSARWRRRRRRRPTATTA